MRVEHHPGLPVPYHPLRFEGSQLAEEPFATWTDTIVTDTHPPQIQTPSVFGWRQAETVRDEDRPRRHRHTAAEEAPADLTTRTQQRRRRRQRRAATMMAVATPASREEGTRLVRARTVVEPLVLREDESLAAGAHLHPGTHKMRHASMALEVLGQFLSEQANTLLAEPQITTEDRPCRRRVLEWLQQAMDRTRDTQRQLQRRLLRVEPEIGTVRIDIPPMPPHPVPLETAPVFPLRRRPSKAKLTVVKRAYEYGHRQDHAAFERALASDDVSVAVAAALNLGVIQDAKQVEALTAAAEHIAVAAAVGDPRLPAIDARATVASTSDEASSVSIALQQVRHRIRADMLREKRVQMNPFLKRQDYLLKSDIGLLLRECHTEEILFLVHSDYYQPPHRERTETCSSSLVGCA